MYTTAKLALVDDHPILRKGLAGIIDKLGYTIILECNNGQDLLEKLTSDNLPDMVLMDINMPKMDGYGATLWLKNNFPTVNVLALSMYDDEHAIIRMIRNGAKGYILKESEPEQLKEAIHCILTQGFYYSEMVSRKVVDSVRKIDEDSNAIKQVLNLNDLEIEFLKLAATELTYKEIATEMNRSPRTVDGYRDVLFEKLNVKSRIGLVVYSIKNGIVQLD